MHVRSALVVLSVAAASLTACESSSDPSTASSTVPIETDLPPTGVPTTRPVVNVPPELAGTSWMFDGTITVGGLQPVPSGTNASISFLANGTLELNTGCNTGSADLSFAGGDSMSVGPATLTEIGCLGDAATVEARMLAVLGEPLTWSVDDDNSLVLIPTTVSDSGLHFSPTT